MTSHTEVTTLDKLTILKLLATGNGIGYAAAASNFDRDVIQSIAAKHGYPDTDNLSKAIAVLEKPWLLAEVARVARERDALAATMERVRALHTPKRDEPWSLVQHEFCSCGAMETYTADDGYPAIGPAHYPCPTVRALDGERTATPGDPLLEVDAASYGPDSVPLAALDAPAGATDDDGSE